MAALERRSGEAGQTGVDLASLGQMVGVKKELEKLVGQGRPLERETVLGILVAQQLVLDGTKGFEKKALALQKVIEELKEHQEVVVGSILDAAGVSRVKVAPTRGFGNLFGHRG